MASPASTVTTNSQQSSSTTTPSSMDAITQRSSNYESSIGGFMKGNWSMAATTTTTAIHPPHSHGSGMLENNHYSSNLMEHYTKSMDTIHANQQYQSIINDRNELVDKEESFLPISFVQDHVRLERLNSIQSQAQAQVPTQTQTRVQGHAQIQAQFNPPPPPPPPPPSSSSSSLASTIAAPYLLAICPKFYYNRGCDSEYCRMAHPSIKVKIHNRRPSFPSQHQSRASQHSTTTTTTPQMDRVGTENEYQLENFQDQRSPLQYPQVPGYVICCRNYIHYGSCACHVLTRSSHSLDNYYHPPKYLCAMFLGEQQALSSASSTVQQQQQQKQQQQQQTSFYSMEKELEEPIEDYVALVRLLEDRLAMPPPKDIPKRSISTQTARVQTIGSALQPITPSCGIGTIANQIYHQNSSDASSVKSLSSETSCNNNWWWWMEPVHTSHTSGADVTWKLTNTTTSAPNSTPLIRSADAEVVVKKDMNKISPNDMVQSSTSTSTQWMRSPTSGNIGLTTASVIGSTDPRSERIPTSSDATCSTENDLSEIVRLGLVESIANNRNVSSRWAQNGGNFTDENFSLNHLLNGAF